MTATFRPGVIPGDPLRPRLRLGRYLTSLKPPPVSVNWDRAVSSFGLYSNDRFGDCVWAMAANAIRSWSANSGQEVDVPESSVLKAYSDVTGFRPDDPSTDNGTVMQDAMSYWRKTGILDATGKPHKILAYAQLDHTRQEELRSAVALFGEVLLAIDFPASAMSQFDAGRAWTVVNGSPSQGGHAICSARYARGRWWVITWGREQVATTGFMSRYLREAWVAIGPEWVSANGTSPSGLDMTALGRDFSVLTGEPVPW